jgi:hypothetical protein
METQQKQGDRAYIFVLSHFTGHIALNGNVFVNGKLERTWDEAVICYFKVLTL